MLGWGFCLLTSALTLMQRKSKAFQSSKVGESAHIRGFERATTWKTAEEVSSFRSGASHYRFCGRKLGTTEVLVWLAEHLFGKSGQYQGTALLQDVVVVLYQQMSKRDQVGCVAKGRAHVVSFFSNAILATCCCAFQLVFLVVYARSLRFTRCVEPNKTDLLCY